MFHDHGQYFPEDYAVNHRSKYNDEDFINCEFELAENIRMKNPGKI